MITRPRFIATLTEFFGISPAASVAAVAFSVLLVLAAVFFFIHSAPPNTITMTSGPEGSAFYTNAVKYANILARQGVKLKILPSEGSLKNLQVLGDPGFKVDVGFVQGGVIDGNTNKLVSLGSLAYQPLLVFYRGEEIDTLSDLTGKRIGIGPQGSGTRNLALMLLAANGIKTNDATTLLDSPPQISSKALLDGSMDAVFLMGEDASTATMRTLLKSTNIHLMSFKQAEAYTRRFSFLSVLKIPEGAIDLGLDIPKQDVFLVGPTVELIARKSLHPALSDLLLEAAQEIHGRASLLQRKGEFPAPIEHDFKISSDATRFYRSGTSFFYRYLPFWLASLTSRIIVVFVPLLVLLIPILRSIPPLYRWRNQARIYRRYRALLILEKELDGPPDPKRREEMLKRLDDIEADVNKMKVPASLANQFYALREHIEMVRQGVGEGRGSKMDDGS